MFKMMTARRNALALVSAWCCLGRCDGFAPSRAATRAYGAPGIFSIRGNNSCRRRSSSRRHKSSRGRGLLLASDNEADEFWTKQKQLLQQMSLKEEKSLQEEQREKFARRRLALVSDTATFGFFIFCLLWICFENPFVALSYAVGATLGLAYSFGLGKYVENLGGDPTQAETSPGSGVGEARFAFLILLFVIVAKFRSNGLVEIPTIGGFFTYQLASLSQGFKQEVDD